MQVDSRSPNARPRGTTPWDFTVTHRGDCDNGTGDGGLRDDGGADRNHNAPGGSLHDLRIARHRADLVLRNVPGGCDGDLRTSHPSRVERLSSFHDGTHGVGMALAFRRVTLAGNDSVKYAEGPSTEVEVLIDAPVERVWELVSDVNLASRFSPEFKGGSWIDDGPRLGARFLGRNEHPARGSWETTSWVTRCEPGRAFGWAVNDPEYPAATWWYTIDEVDGGVRLRHGGRMGPAPSGLTMAIARAPEKEDRIVAHRLEEWRRGMQATVEGIKALAEGRL